MIQDNSVLSPLKDVYVQKCKELCMTFDEVDLEWLRLQVNDNIKKEDLYNIEIVEMSNNPTSTLDECVLNAEIKFNDIGVIYHFVLTFNFSCFDFDETGKDKPYASDLQINSLKSSNREIVFYLKVLFDSYINEMFNIKDKMLEMKFKEYRNWCNIDMYKEYCNMLNNKNKKED